MRTEVRVKLPLACTGPDPIPRCSTHSTALQTRSPDLALVLPSPPNHSSSLQAGAGVTSQLLKSISVREPCLEALLRIELKGEMERGESLERIWLLPAQVSPHQVSCKRQRTCNACSAFL